MDNKKIGKLIADLRRKQGLTQQDLGDKVGVGFRAVSKWERGLTLPDISIINELSKILGITSDELLTGKINKETKSKEKRKLSNKIKITITIVTLIIIILSSVFIYFNNKTYVYGVYSVNQDKYYVDGNVIIKGNNLSLIINEIKFKDPQVNLLKVKNYEYEISTNGKFIFKFGYLQTADMTEPVEILEKFVKKIDIKYIGNTNINKNYIDKHNIVITLRFLNEYNKVFVQKIELKLNREK